MITHDLMCNRYWLLWQDYDLIHLKIVQSYTEFLEAAGSLNIPDTAQ